MKNDESPAGTRGGFSYNSRIIGFRRDFALASNMAEAR